MDDTWLADQFEEHRGHLRAVAYRMLGSTGDADDAVQEAWFRLTRADAREITNLRGWLTTVVARICLDQLRSRESRRESPLETASEPAGGVDPEHQAVLADAVGPALLVVLETLAPAERLAFVLHDLFAVPFDEIAPVVGRTPAAARQLASRARRRVQGASSPGGDARAVVAAFLDASRNGNFAGLLALLDPDVVLRADAAVVEFGGVALARGAAGVAETFSGRARAATLALVDGVPGAAWAPGGTPKVLFDFTVRDGRVTAIEMLADPETLAAVEVELIDRA